MTMAAAKWVMDNNFTWIKTWQTPSVPVRPRTKHCLSSEVIVFGDVTDEMDTGALSMSEDKETINEEIDTEDGTSDLS